MIHLHLPYDRFKNLADTREKQDCTSTSAVGTDIITANHAIS
jgi:hypothetical protein